MVDFLMYTIVALIGAFAVLGIYLIVRAIRMTYAAERAERGPLPRRSLRKRARDYVGESKESSAILTPPFRVAAEFVMALCGFPGIGWLASGHLVTGLVLIVLGPGLMWAAAPVIMAATGGLMQDPFVTVRFLPVLAVASAGSLAIAEARRSRVPESA